MKAFQDLPCNSTKPINFLKFSWQRCLCQQYIKPSAVGCSSNLNSYKNVWVLKTYSTEAASLDISSPKWLQIASLRWKSKVIVGKGNGELRGEGPRGQGWEKKRCKLQSWRLLGGERDYFKEIAPENVTSSRRLLVQSVFSVGKRLDSGGRESVKEKLWVRDCRHYAGHLGRWNRSIRYKHRRRREEVWRRERSPRKPLSLVETAGCCWKPVDFSCPRPSLSFSLAKF